MHPLRLMLSVHGFEAQTVAVLHDVLEDTSVILHDLRVLSLSNVVLTAVSLLTHDECDPYNDYIERLSVHPVARMVKAADLTDNLHDNRRLPTLVRVLDRIHRYETALRRLNGGTQLTV